MLSRVLAACLLILSATLVRAQEGRLQGAVFQKGTSSRLAGALVRNEANRERASTDKLGVFSIRAAVGDTLTISCIGFLDQRVVVKDFQDLLIYLLKSNQLAEVNIYSKTLIQDLKEVEDQFRAKGIYYKGRPPLLLLLPFGGSPLTFFHELLSKDGKRARRFSKYADREIAFYTVASRFTEYLIKNTVPIRDEVVADFQLEYWPTVEEIKQWNDVDLISYIRRSWDDFKQKRPDAVKPSQPAP